MYATSFNERQARFDWQMMVAIAGLMCLGVAFIYSATMVDAGASLPWYRQRHFWQIVWYGIGAVCAAVICLIDYRTLSRWSLVAYWAAILLLIAVLIPGIGSMRYGARRWLDLGLLQFQPSEFAKLAFIFLMAHFLSRPLNELRLPGLFFKALGMTMLPFVLVLKEPDLGSALLFLPVGLVMMFVAGVPANWLAKLVGGTGLLLLLMVLNILFAPERWRIPLEDYQRRRLLVYFDRDYVSAGAPPEVRRKALIQQRNDSYNVQQALISVGSGGLTGKGWREGTQNALGYLPRGVAHNDFIFSVIAEEKGFVGSVMVITLYIVVLFTGIRVASQARDRLGKILAAGVVTLLFSQVFINIGMNIRMVPVTGVPLPLLSYGGSSVLGSLIAVGILQNIHIHRKTY